MEASLEEMEEEEEVVEVEMGKSFQHPIYRH